MGRSASVEGGEIQCLDSVGDSDRDAERDAREIVVGGFSNDAATSEGCAEEIVGSVRCVFGSGDRGALFSTFGESSFD